MSEIIIEIVDNSIEVEITYPSQGGMSAEMTPTVFGGSSVLFDKVIGRDYGQYEVNSDVTIVPDSTGKIVGGAALIRLVGDGIHNVVFSGFETASGSLEFDNTSGTENFVVFFYNGSVYAYNIVNQYDAVVVDDTAPILQSATVENASPNQIYLNYNEALNSTAPSIGSFGIGGKTISGVSISGTRVIITVAIPFVHGDIIAINYTAPGVNPVQDLAGNLASNLVSQAVTNNVAAADTTAPQLSSAHIESAAPTQILLDYNETLSTGSVPLTSQYTVSGGRTVNSVGISGSRVIITVNTAYSAGDTIVISYNPTGNPVRDAAGNNAASLSNQAVTNNIAASVPAVTSITVEDATPNQIFVNYDQALDAGSVPANSAYTPSGGRSVSGVSISGSRVIVTVNNPYTTGDSVTLGYAVPALNPVQNSSGTDASSFSGQAVTNNIVIPVLSTATVEDAAKNQIILTYNQALDTSSVPAGTDFTVSGGKTVSNVGITGSVVTLTTNSDYASGDVITVSYTKGSNPIQDINGNDVANLVSRSVTNNITASAQSLTILAASGISKSGDNYTSTSGSSWSPVAVFNQYLPSGANASVIFEMTEAALSQGIMVGLSSSQTNHKYSESPNYYGMFIQEGAPTMFSLPSFGQLNPAFANGSKIRIIRNVSNNLLLQYAGDGVNFVTKTDYGTVTGPLYVHVNIQATGESITGLVGYGLTT